MRILIHTDEYYPTAQACTYRMSVLAEAFLQRGHAVTVITGSANRAAGDMVRRPERILYSPSIPMRRKTAVMRMLSNLSFGITSVFTALGAGRADVVITTSPPPLISPAGWLIARCKGARLIYDVRDIWPEVALEMGSFSPESGYCRVFRGITRFMYRHADWVTTVSPGKVEKIRDHVISAGGRKGGEAHADKVKLVGNGFDERILGSSVDRALIEEYQLDQYFTCVYIGNIGLAQGLGSLLDLAEHSRCRKAQFLLFGKGAEKERLEQEARERGLDNVHFCGVLPHEKVYTLYAHAGLCYVPLKNASMKDSIPSKLYEALGVGCPVLLFAEGDACGIVRETGLGCCVSPDHPEQLAEAFDEMAEHHAEYLGRRAWAQELMRTKYSRQQIALRFEEQLEGLVQQKYKRSKGVMANG